MEHISVLLNESIDMLQIKEDGIYVDCTLGRGGHSSEILKRLTSGHLYAFDCDQNAIDESTPRLQAIGDNFTLIHSPFENLNVLFSNNFLRIRVDHGGFGLVPVVEVASANES